jgi:hypothetical protein
MNATLAAITYNSRAVPVLGFLGQLQPLPRIQCKERATLHHLMHLPTNSWDRHLFAHLDKLGGTQILQVSTNIVVPLLSERLTKPYVDGRDMSIRLD